VKQIVDEFSRVQDLADRFGMSSETVQRLGYAAGQTGTEIETLARAMGLANRNGQEAARGNDELANAFRRLGIDAKEFAGLDQERQLMMLADAFANATDRNMAMAEAQRILGRNALELVPLLQGGSEAIIEFGKAAGVASEMAVSVLENTGDTWASVWAKIKSGTAEAVAAIILGIQGMAAVIMETGGALKDLFTGDFQQLGQRNVFDAFVRPIKDEAEATIDRIQNRARAVENSYEDEAGAAEDSAKRQEDAFKKFYQARERDIAKVKEQERDAAEFRMESLQMMEDAEWDAMKQAEAAADAAAAARRDRQQAAEQSRLGSAASALESMLGRVTASDSLQSVGLGFRDRKSVV
jgi:hypothetical protein